VIRRQVGQYFVYVLASRSRALYVGVTNNLERRVYEHKHKLVPGFTARHNIVRLVHFEETEDIVSAIERERLIKGWTRAKKVALVEATNPTWEDLAADWSGTRTARPSVPPGRSGRQWGVKAPPQPMSS